MDAGGTCQLLGADYRCADQASRLSAHSVPLGLAGGEVGQKAAEKAAATYSNPTHQTPPDGPQEGS